MPFFAHTLADLGGAAVTLASVSRSASPRHLPLLDGPVGPCQVCGRPAYWLGRAHHAASLVRRLGASRSVCAVYACESFAWHRFPELAEERLDAAAARRLLHTPGAGATYAL
jgi:hypothetical protein